MKRPPNEKPIAVNDVTAVTAAETFVWTFGCANIFRDTDAYVRVRLDTFQFLLILIRLSTRYHEH